MALRITTAMEALNVSNITLCAYSVPGIGKTSLGFTASKPILLDFDRGAYRSGNRGDTVQVESWTDVSSITAADLAPYDTVACDTVGRALDVLTAHIMADDPKARNRNGGLTLPGYGVLKTVFGTWLKFVRNQGKDIVLICHSDENRDGDDLIERLDVQGGSKNEIYKSTDVMGRLYLKGGKRVLNFSPTDTAFGKNPAQMPPLEVPDFKDNPHFLAGVISGVKKAFIALSAEQTEISGMLDEWGAKIATCEDADAFNEMLPFVVASDPKVRDRVKLVLNKAAKAKGCAYDTKAKAFVGAA